MTAAAQRPRAGRRRWVLALVVVVVVAVGAVVFWVIGAIPDYRIAFLIDASAAQAPGPVADAVGAAVQNTGGGDALSLRRFGGRCGDPRNTAQIVGAGTGQAARIDRSVHRLAPTGVATLESGILAAINDFSGHYPFRGTRSNRIIVVTGQGTDACTSDQTAMNNAIKHKADAAGLHLDFRFVGYQTPTSGQADLTHLATTLKAPTPDFTRTQAELTATLKQLLIPKPHQALPVKIPALPAAFVGQWGVHTSVLRVNPDGTGRFDWNAGPCAADPVDHPDGPMCEGHASLHVTAAASAVEVTATSVWYTQWDGLAPGYFDAPSTPKPGHLATLRTVAPGVLKQDDDGEVGNPYLCRSDASPDWKTRCNV
ncbi:hypothetical protein GCM10029978_038960 [Actinoallomurus acanthiterrae]